MESLNDDGAVPSKEWSAHVPVLRRDYFWHAVQTDLANILPGVFFYQYHLTLNLIQVIDDILLCPDKTMR